MKKIKHIIILTFLCLSTLFSIFAYTNTSSVIPVIKTIETSVINYEEINDESKEDFESMIEEKEDNKENILKEEHPKDNQNSEKKDNIENLEKNNTIITEIKDVNIENIKKDQARLGTHGRLYLPSFNYSVALFHASLYDESLNAQVIVDNKDSAAHFSLENHYIIADHNYQGFKILIYLNIGDKAYIKNDDGSIFTYSLKDKFIGENTKTDLVSKQGVSIKNMEADLIMYTCYNTGNDIMITLWNLETS